MIIRRFIALSAVLATLSACGGAKTFTTSQLATILPGSTNAPPGLQFVPGGSGPQQLKDIVKDNTEGAKLTSYGFTSAYSSFFANRGAIAVLSRATTTADPASHVVATLGVVFKTPDGAKKALVLEHASDVASGTSIKTVPVAKLGDETIAESGTQEGIPFPGYLVYWREGNALFGVLVAGGPTSGVTLGEARAIASIMDASAQKA